MGNVLSVEEIETKPKSKDKKKIVISLKMHIITNDRDEP